jgi:signal transduction histidine kinase
MVRREPPLQEDVDLLKVMDAVRDHLEDEALAARVGLEIRSAPESIGFRGDAVQLEQMLVNLVRNAIESFRGGDPDHRVVTMEATEVKNCVVIRVEDNGPGIADEVRDRLFEALISTKKAGRGLGLVICRLVAEMYGGRVRVERSGPGGTCMVVELPTVVGGSS